MTLSKCEGSAHAQLLRKLKAVFFPNLILSINVCLILIYLLGDGGVTFKNKDMPLFERGFL